MVVYCLKKWMNKPSKPIWILLLSFAAVFLLFVTFFGRDVFRLLYQPMAIHRNEMVIVQLDRNTSAASFVKILKQKKLIQADGLFLYLIRLQGFSAQLKAGIYQVHTSESAESFLKRVVAGDVLKESFRIIEGTTEIQVDENLKNTPWLKYNHDSWLSIKKTHLNAEGLLLADTYLYDAGSGSDELLFHAHANLMRFLKTSWENRSPNLPYASPYDLLIAASIIEKETSLSQERRLISGVIVNRLRKKMPLQVDPTVIYALGMRYNGKITRKNLQVDSPYNTYRNRGLPPTPIAMVGKDAIDAAAHPLATNYLYFVAKGDGSHQFSATYDQQIDAVARFIKNKP